MCNFGFRVSQLFVVFGVQCSQRLKVRENEVKRDFAKFLSVFTIAVLEVLIPGCSLTVSGRHMFTKASVLF
jgi:hypothetical protein